MVKNPGGRSDEMPGCDLVQCAMQRCGANGSKEKRHINLEFAKMQSSSASIILASRNYYCSSFLCMHTTTTSSLVVMTF